MYIYTYIYIYIYICIYVYIPTGRAAWRTARLKPTDRVSLTVVGCKIPRKENPPIIRFFHAPPLPASPGLPEADPTIDKNKRSG